jgi:hypothetical protein
MLNIRVYGKAARGIFGKDMQDTIAITMPRRDECDVSCASPNLCYLGLDELVNGTNNSWVAPAIRAEKILSCCDSTPVSKFVCQEYVLTLCGTGDEMELASIQGQYSSAVIEVKERKGSLTTYSMWLDAGAPAPAAYTQTNVVIAGCDACPAGYTTVAAGKLLTVQIDNDGLATTDAQALTEVQAKIPTAVKAKKVGFNFGTSIYIVSVPETYVIPATPIADTKITDTGSTSPKHCTLTTPISTAWTIGADKYRIKRELHITLDNPDCAGNDLPKLVSYYGSLKSVVAGSVVGVDAGDCKSTFKLEQYSHCMEDGCDTVAVAKFDDLPSFKGQSCGVNLCEGWTVSGTGCPIPPPDASIQDCRCGIKLIGGFLDNDSKSCIFDPCQAVNYDPLLFEVQIYEQMEVGEPGGTRPMKTPVSYNRETTRVFLSGNEVVRDILEYRHYRQNEMFMNPQAFAGAYLYNQAEGQKLGVDISKFYYAVYINHDKHGRIVNSHMGMAEKTELALYFAEDNYPAMVQFLTAYNTYGMSAGVSLPTIAI